jgi:quercetin dioxygenase-like cupin family protein
VAVRDQLTLRLDLPTEENLDTMMITRRDIVVAMFAASAAAGMAATAQQSASIMKSSVFEWSSVSARSTGYGSVRQFMRAPTVTLDELELHVTTLNPGQTSHAPHQHPNEELIIIREGTVETLSNGEWKRLEAGSVIFNASNDLHGIRNVGTGPATYHVINWRSPGALKKGQ